MITWNGKEFFLKNFWETSKQLQLFTDASGSIGFGGSLDSNGFKATGEPIRPSVTTASLLLAKDFMQL